MSNPPIAVAAIAGNTDNLQIIRNAFQAISSPVNLQEIQFAETGITEKEIAELQPDCIVTDDIILAALDKKQLKLMQPLIVFNTTTQVLNYNNTPVLDVISIPVVNGNLQHAIDKLTLLKRFFQHSKSTPTAAMPQAEKELNKTFVVKRGKEFQLVHSKQITAFYSENKVTFGLDESGNKFIIPYTLIELENELNHHLFFRANRQFLVNRNFIQKIRQQDDNRFEIIINEAEKPRVDISYQSFSKLKNWLES
ncbi:MAG: LytTR family transcriptional regulator DNA-binding domain-containing protein [Bacteroidetes bacterium]|nr:LytTR family transcriptional regulator DNA-binding domain-containing protein [Bacteroidota bacterium]